VSGGCQPFYLPAGSARSGQRFCIYHPPLGDTVAGIVVHVHALAEEMNKSRRMAAMQSRQLAQAGFAVLQIDLFGCGDSSGSFGDASWNDWLNDVVLAAAWLRARHTAPLWLWGQRVGCLLACGAAPRLEEPVGLLFWQPPSSGKVVLQQFLRLKLAGAALEGAPPATRDDPRAEFAAGRTVAVAGYEVSPALAEGLEAALLCPPPRLRQAVWLETSPREDAALLPATQKAVQAWAAAGPAPIARVVTGPAFWQTLEVEDAPALLRATLDAVLPERVAL
jgi:uncharacterized protein